MKNNKLWLDSVIRIPNSKETRHTNCVRLDKSERIFRFEKEFFDKFLDSLTQEDFIAYPETAPLIERLCRYHNIKEENLFLTPGSDPAIKAFFEIAVQPGDEVIITKPCFPMYKVYGKLFNAKLIEVSYKPNLTFDFECMLNSITDKTSLVLLANPNSPIGNFLEADFVEQLVARANKYGIPILIDEAYYEYSSGTSMDLIKKYNNLGVSRTFSKALGGAGIRIGYVVGSRELIKNLSKWRLMYEINQVGVKFTTYLLDNIEIVLDYAAQTKKERELLVEMLVARGYDVISSEGNWIHFHGKEHNAKALGILKKHNVLFKDNTKIPFDKRNDWIRLTVGPGLSQTPYMNDIFALKKGVRST